jgi:trimethylamine corrinoid protein
MTEKSVLEAARQTIIEQDRAQAVQIAQRAIAEGGDLLELMNAGFIPGINAVGDLFGRGELFLPALMKAADAMKAVTELLNEAIASRGAAAQAAPPKVLVATVQGDVHDIGKCIVVSLFRANGFIVHDLGRDVPLDKIIEAAVAHEVDVIGTSTLLTTTMVRQKELEEALKKAGLRERFKTIVGGAPVTPRWAARIGADAYAEDAQDGVRIVKELLQPKP